MFSPLNLVSSILNKGLPPLTYYVSTSGNNANTGLSQSQAWQTLAYAESHATTPGCVIALKKGDIFEMDNVFVISHSGGPLGNRIIWKGSAWGSGVNTKIKANVDGADGAVAYAMLQIAGCKYVTMKNIKFDGNNKKKHGVTIGGCDQESGPIPQNDEAYITIEDCEILNVGRDNWYCHGILVQTWHNNMSNITIQRNVINGVGAQAISFYPGRSNEGSPAAIPAEILDSYVGYNSVSNFGRSGSFGCGIMVNNKTTNIIIEHNTVLDDINGTGSGISINSNEPNLGYFPTGIIVRYNKVTINRTNEWCFFAQQGQAQTVDIYYNIFIQGNNLTDTNGGCVWFAWDYGNPWTGAVYNFWNNTIYSLSGRTFQIDCPIADVVRAKNNIFYNTGTLADIYGNQFCFRTNTTAAVTHSNNSYYRSVNIGYLKVIDNDYYYTNAQVLAWEETAKPTDPLLVTPGSNFHLQAGSPAIGAGVNIPTIPQVDYDGVEIVDPIHPCIGAYEHV
jgi:hypothetical protein